MIMNNINSQSGRSLIEIIGVIAIAGVMTAASITAFSTIRNNQTRTIASAQLQEIARDVKILMEMRGTYDGVSVNYLVKSGALTSDAAPIGDSDWSVTATNNGAAFAINLTGLSSGECQYFAIHTPKWAKSVVVNGYESNNGDACFSSATNRVSFTVE